MSKGNIISQTFKAIYNATTETIHKVKEPLVLNKNKRAIESAIDSAIDSRLEAEDKLEKELLVVSKGEVINVNNVLKHMQAIEDAERTEAALKELKAQFFAEDTPSAE